MTYEDHAEQVRPLAEHRGRAKYLTPILRVSPTCQHPETKHGANSEWSWVKCLRCGQVDQIPKMPLDQLHHWNQVLAFQKPNYETRQERRADQGSGENGQPFDSWDELCGASSGDYSGDAARTPDHGHWNPSVGRLWDSSERIGDGDERPGDGCAQPLEAGGRLRTSCESSRADATMPSLPSWRSSSVSRCRREPDVLDVQRRNSGLSVPSPDSPHTPDFGHRGSPVRDVSTRGSPEPEAPRSRCFSVSSLRGHDSGNGVGGGAENGGYNPNLLNQAS